MRTGSCKICVVGAPGTGKSSLIHRLVHDRFPPATASPGISVSSIRLATAPGQSVAVTLWDVAGSSLIDCLNQAFLSRVNALACVVNSTSGASLATATALMNQIRRLHPHAVAAVLHNSFDPLPTAGGIESLPDRTPVYVVSARDGDGVAVAFGAIAQAAHAYARPAAALEAGTLLRAQ